MNFKTITRPALSIALSAVFAMFAHAASAVPFTEGFESGFGTWGSLGDVSVKTGGPAAPAAGSAYLLLSTASLGADDFPSAAKAFNFSGTAAAASSALETGIGASAGALDPDLDNFVFATEGSAVSKNFAVSSGETLTFSWNFLSNEGGAGSPDYAFFSLDGAIFRLADALAGLQPSSVFGEQTGYQSFSHTFVSSGIVNIAFGVVDVSDGSVTSALAIDNLQITSVPEPSMGMMMVLSMGILGISELRRRRRAAA